MFLVLIEAVKLSEERRLKIESSNSALALAQEAVERKRELEQALRAQREAEEALRAPLRAMQGLGAALVEDYAGMLDPIGQDYAHRIVTAAKRMDELIKDLLASESRQRLFENLHAIKPELVRCRGIEELRG